MRPATYCAAVSDGAKGMLQTTSILLNRCYAQNLPNVASRYPNRVLAVFGRPAAFAGRRWLAA